MGLGQNRESENRITSEVLRMDVNPESHRNTDTFKQSRAKVKSKRLVSANQLVYPSQLPPSLLPPLSFVIPCMYLFVSIFL